MILLSFIESKEEKENDDDEGTKNDDVNDDRLAMIVDSVVLPVIENVLFFAKRRKDMATLLTI